MTITFMPPEHVGKFKCSVRLNKGYPCSVWSDEYIICGKDAILVSSYPIFMCKECSQYFSDSYEGVP